MNTIDEYLAIVGSMNKLPTELGSYCVSNVYLYGSRVYGTARKDSDYDFIIVVEDRLENGSIQLMNDMVNITIYDLNMFQQLLNDHEISILECIFLPDDKKIEKRHFEFNLDLKKLRKSLSKKSSNSYVKAKKKMTVEKDFDVYVAQKSLFHSFRILHFGAQLAKCGKIVNYSEANWVWDDIVDSKSVDWNEYHSGWHNTYNLLKTMFRKAAPI